MHATSGVKLSCADIPWKKSKTKVWSKRSTTITNQSCEVEYDFTLLLDGIDEITPDIEDALFTAGCDDATISNVLELQRQRQVSPELTEEIMAALSLS